MKKISDICKTAAGGTPLKSNKAFYEGGDIPWLLSGEVGGDITKTKNFITQAGLAGSSAKIFPVNTVLVAMYGATAGEVGILRCEAATNQAVCGIYPNENISPEYLYYFFLNHKDQLVAQAVGNAQPNISQQKIKDTEIDLPCLSIQKRIVAILDETFADIEQVRAKTEQNLKNARELFESYLQQVFSQRGEEWIEKTLGDVCKFENGDRGKNYPSRSQFVESGFAFINAGHIDDGTVDFSKMNYITEENYDLLSRGKVKQGDILFCLRGSLGKFAVIEDDAQGAIASSLVIVRPHNDLSVSFLLHYLRSGLCKSMIEKYAGGAAQPNLGAKDLAKFSISVPPTAQQLHTSDKLDSLMVAVENLESMYSDKLAALDELKKSILQKAFSGELTKASDNKTKQGALA